MHIITCDACNIFLLLITTYNVLERKRERVREGGGGGEIYRLMYLFTSRSIVRHSFRNINVTFLFFRAEIQITGWWMDECLLEKCDTEQTNNIDLSIRKNVRARCEGNYDDDDCTESYGETLSVPRANSFIYVSEEHSSYMRMTDIITVYQINLRTLCNKSCAASFSSKA